MSKFTLDWLKSVTITEFKQQAGRIAPASQDLADLNEVLTSDEGKKIAYEMLNDPDYIPISKRTPSPEEAAQIAADEAFAAQQAAEAAEAAAAAAVAATPPPAVVPLEEKKKIVVDYQATDEDGRPIGRPTHIEGWTWEEVSKKQQDAHVNAVRYAERVKSNRVKQSAATTQFIEGSSAAKVARNESNKLAEEAVNEKDPAKMQEAVKKSVQAEREAQIAEEAARAHGRIIADTWMTDHEEEFAPIIANSNILGDWLKANSLPLTYDNLEKAFAACKHQIQKPERRAVSEPVPAAPVANPPASATVAPVASAPPIAVPAAVSPETPLPPAVPQASSQPQAPTAPAPPPAAAPIAQPAARRPGVNGGIQPGAMSAARPATQPQPSTTTRAELLKAIKLMSSEQFRKKLRDANYVKQLEAAGISYR